MKRFVWARDGGQCTFVSDDGGRCPERHALELDHDEPYTLGGDRSPYNIRLACRTHNLYMAELHYGKEKMDRYRRSPDRVDEPAPAFNFELCLDTVQHDATQHSTLPGARSPYASSPTAYVCLVFMDN